MNTHLLTQQNYVCNKNSTREGAWTFMDMMSDRIWFPESATLETTWIGRLAAGDGMQPRPSRSSTSQTQSVPCLHLRRRLQRCTHNQEKEKAEVKTTMIRPFLYQDVQLLTVTSLQKIQGHHLMSTEHL